MSDDPRQAGRWEPSATGAGPFNLDAQHVRDIAAAMGREGRHVRDSGYEALNLCAGHFGDSSAARGLGVDYDGAYADSAQQNAECSAVLDGFQVGLSHAVDGLEETDDLSGVALRRIGGLDPGEATSWKRR